MNPYGICHHTKYEGCPPCIHSAWEEGVRAAREALVTAERRLHFDGETNRWIVEIHALSAIDALRATPTRINMEDPL